METMKRNLFVKSLGCHKNEVDAQRLEQVLAKDGFSVTKKPKDADLIIINKVI